MACMYCSCASTIHDSRFTIVMIEKVYTEVSEKTRITNRECKERCSRVELPTESRESESRGSRFLIGVLVAAQHQQKKNNHQSLIINHESRRQVSVTSINCESICRSGCEAGASPQPAQLCGSPIGIPARTVPHSFGAYTFLLVNSPQAHLAQLCSDSRFGWLQHQTRCMLYWTVPCGGAADYRRLQGDQGDYESRGLRRNSLSSWTRPVWHQAIQYLSCGLVI